MNFFRAQTKGYSFEQMREYTSQDGGDDLEEQGGVCACDSVSDLIQNTVMDAMDDDDEVVVFEADVVSRIYDGYRVLPVKEIVRFSVAHFIQNANQIATEYERW